MAEPFIDLGAVQRKVQSAAAQQEALAAGRVRNWTDIPWSEKAQMLSGITFTYTQLLEGARLGKKPQDQALYAGILNSLGSVLQGHALMAAVSDTAGIPKASVMDHPKQEPSWRAPEDGDYTVSFACGHPEKTSTLPMVKGEIIYTCAICGSHPNISLLVKEQEQGTSGVTDNAPSVASEFREH